MKLLLIQPPVEDFYDTPIRLQPLGLCSLKAAVRRFLPEVEVAVRDFHHGFGRATLTLPAELRDLAPFYPDADQSPFSTFHLYCRYGAADRTIAEEVARERPDVVGVASMFSPYFREVLSCACAVKSVLPGAKVVVGGAHASVCPRRMLQSPDVDFVVRGEGERPLVELLRALLSGRDPGFVPGVGGKTSGVAAFSEPAPNFPFEELPPPDFSDFAPEKHLFEKRPLSQLLTSRGCPYGCRFCSVHNTFGRAYRARPAARVLEEMEALYARGIRVFDFEDDNLTFDLARAKDLMRSIARGFSGRGIELLAMNGVCYQNLDAELLACMKEAGFSRLNLALVSADPALMRSIGRPHDLSAFRAIVDAAFAQGFKITVYQILGLPGESLDSMASTLALTSSLPVLLGASVYYQTPVPDGGAEPSDRDLFLARSTAMVPAGPEASREDLYTLFIFSRMVNFLKSLSLSAPEIPLSGVLSGAAAACADDRARLGLELLGRLLRDGELSGFNPRRGFFGLPRFNAPLFFRIWRRIALVRTLAGQTIRF